MDDMLNRLESRLASHRRKVADLEAAIRIIRQELDLESTDSATTDDMEQSRRLGGMPTERRPRINGDDRAEVRPRPFATDRIQTGDLFGFKIAQAAEAVLNAYPAGEWVNYREIAEKAMRRGYRGRNPDQDKKAVNDSFYHTMKRLHDQFDARGPLFKLRKQS